MTDGTVSIHSCSIRVSVLSSALVINRFIFRELLLTTVNPDIYTYTILNSRPLWPQHNYVPHAKAFGN